MPSKLTPAFVIAISSALFAQDTHAGFAGLNDEQTQRQECIYNAIKNTDMNGARIIVDANGSDISQERAVNDAFSIKIASKFTKPYSSPVTHNMQEYLSFTASAKHHDENGQAHVEFRRTMTITFNDSSYRVDSNNLIANMYGVQYDAARISPSDLENGDQIETWINNAAETSVLRAIECLYGEYYLKEDGSFPMPAVFPKLENQYQ